LVDGVVAIAGVLVDGGRLEQPDPVVVAQRLDAHVGGAREVADRELHLHPSIGSPLGGGSSAPAPLDPLPRAWPIVSSLAPAPSDPPPAGAALASYSIAATRAGAA